ncbi:TonB system transport protein ExbD [Campylobacter sp. RM9344]|uniref:Biopolymer transport protein ExbD n=1 Tax=Campylobacter californiensis TaxID=1032243 RepID=A0AAW3ZTG2_9BACT|nr:MULTISPECIES: TonB system transport protein ExbD [unclassified Campylobacter]MBE2984198.1 TonB system transport protein ExbD [Campylobacter sp. RM6883]MBE2986178.1 TonB system transport protein ExbD [Campylobacter sp. RM12919]MBE2988175.1 TonB system transport protein ExbD [Campylobacter sp. RM12920]MBE2995567.1 TonB system transport protein ExbD [Campylobacter sp. RM6913]MBE3029764.1 TonB system transport protein ExbD [Campylobacter sp. RM9344]
MRLNRKDGLNIVPFIDIMLVLLAIVLSISTFIAQGNIPIDLPSSNSAKQEKDDKKVSIVIDKDNKIFIDETEVYDEELKDKLSNVDPKMLIELRSDKESKFDTFVKVIDILKEKQHENFAITTITK